MIEINEKTFIKLFVDKKLQDRLLYESASQKKRCKFFSRLAHNSSEVLDKSTVILKTENLSFELLEDLFRKLKIKSPQYGTTLALYEDNKKISYESALSFLDEIYSKCIIILDNGCAIVKEEANIGTPIKYVLYSSTNKF